MPAAGKMGKEVGHEDKDRASSEST
jgi:hypothetical protein